MLMRSAVALAVAAISLAVHGPDSGSIVRAAEEACVRVKGGYRCLYGPFDVGHGDNQFRRKVAAPARDGYITGARATVVDRRGEPVSGHHVHLHHAGWIDLDSEQVYCPSDWGMVYQTGNERTRMRFPDGHGYRWDTGTATEPKTWTLDAMFHGMHEGPTSRVFIRLNVRHKGPAADLAQVQNQMIPVTGCTQSTTFDVAKGSGTDGKYIRHHEFEWPKAGRFVWGTGHLHSGGRRMVLRNLTQGHVVFVSRARYDDPSDPRYLTQNTTWSSKSGVQVNEGDLMRVTAVYDSSRNLEDVMANLRVTLAP